MPTFSVPRVRVPRRRKSPVFGVLAAVLLSGSAAHATIIERVVAVVGERPLLLSELQTRTLPFLKQMRGAGSDKAAAESQLFSEMLSRMVDEELLRDAAVKAKITVGKEEIDAAIARVAKGNEVTQEELMIEVERSGVSPSQYRREIRRQLLDAKVMNLRLQGRIRVSQDELTREYDELVGAERQQLQTTIAAIRVLIPSDLSGDQKRALQTHVASLAQQARSGSNFAELSRLHSTDKATQESGGVLPAMAPVQMPKELASLIVTLEVGDVSAPVKSGDHWVILKVLDRAASQLPPLAKARQQLEQRVQMKKMEEARRTWLDSLRTSTHVEIRL